MISAAIYARFSTDLQRNASIEDQIRVCREHAERQGWQIAQCYTDHAVSGASMMRPGVQMLMQDAAAGKFNIVLSEALDRLSRDQEDVAAIFKRMQFAEIKIVTLSEGEVSPLHIGLRGTMNALTLKDTADKVRRGLRGRVEQGKSAGSLPYGYEVVKKFDASGEPIRGDRMIKDEEARVVIRICEDYAKGKSPKAIAKELNRENIPSPTGKQWTQSTINGNRRRGIGILNNEIYVGVMVWNRLRMVKDPDTGKRISRVNPEEEWIRKDVPELQIVPDELWQRVKARQKALPDATQPFWKKQRPKYLLSGLLKCGCCGGGFSKANHGRYGCSTARNKGTCGNKLKVDQFKLETLVTDALKAHLMDPALCAVFCTEYAAQMNRMRSEKNARLSSFRAELDRLEAGRKRLIEAIKSGVPGADVKDEMIAIGERRKIVEAELANIDEEPVLLHPAMAFRYQEEIERLLHTINDDECRAEATEIIRSLVDRIVLTPNEDGSDLQIDLHGDLAGIISIARKGEDPLETSDFETMVLKLVAEEGLEPPTRGL